MQDNLKKANQYLFMVLIVLLSGCNFQMLRPTLDPNIIETIAAKTVGAQLTATKLAIPPTATQPIPTSAPTLTATLVLTPTQTVTETTQAPLLLPGTTGMIYAASTVPKNPSTSTPVPPSAGDFGIPIDHDPINGTIFQRNQEFDMTWTFRNAGTTTWNKDFYITFFGGDRIGNGDNSYFLGKEIKPGEIGSIYVKMVAPDSTGTYKSIWMMMNDHKKAFMELNVVIEVP
jgi:hypothetical protein